MKNTIIPSNLYIMFTDEAAKRCVRAGCSVDKAVDIIRMAEKELAKKATFLGKMFEFEPRRGFPRRWEFYLLNK